VLFIHGWSDSWESFQSITKILKDHKFIWSYYESRADAVTFTDLVHALQAKLIKENIIDKHGNALQKINVVVHSTGGLIIRHWISKFYPPRENKICPVVRIIMLAPANFGSPLAHKGRSFLGVLAKGISLSSLKWEVGVSLLKGLEIGSEYLWDLAEKDLLDNEKTFYSAKGILVTVFVGDQGYHETIRSYINKVGTDGTVYISGTKLVTVKYTFDISHSKNTKQKSAADTAFAIIRGLDHSTILNPSGAYAKLFLEALLVDSSRFDEFRKKLAAEFSSIDEPFQLFMVRALDDNGKSIRDYHLEFFVAEDKGPDYPLTDVYETKSEWSKFSDELNSIINGQFHDNTVNSSYRTFLFDHKKFLALVNRVKKEKGNAIIGLSLHVPPVDSCIVYDLPQKHQLFQLYRTAETGTVEFLMPNVATMVEIRVNRLCSYFAISSDPEDLLAEKIRMRSKTED